MNSNGDSAAILATDPADLNLPRNHLKFSFAKGSAAESRISFADDSNECGLSAGGLRKGVAQYRLVGKLARINGKICDPAADFKNRPSLHHLPLLNLRSSLFKVLLALASFCRNLRLGPVSTLFAPSSANIAPASFRVCDDYRRLDLSLRNPPVNSIAHKRFSRLTQALMTQSHAFQSRVTPTKLHPPIILKANDRYVKVFRSNTMRHC